MATGEIETGGFLGGGTALLLFRSFWGTRKRAPKMLNLFRQISKNLDKICSLFDINLKNSIQGQRKHSRFSKINKFADLRKVQNMLKLVPQDRAPYADSKMVLKISVAQKTKKLEPFEILGRNPELSD